MTPINKVRPRWIDRCLYRRKHWLANIGWALLILLVAIGLWSSITSERRVAEAEAATKRAEADRQEVLDVLSGKLAMISPLGEQYQQVARIEWDIYRVDDK